MRFLFLHLSDFHFGDSNAYNDFHISKIADATNLFSSYQHVLIVISGDIAYSGGKKQYTAAKGFVEKLTECLKERRPGLESFHVLCVPGNHDLDHSVGALSSKMLQDIRKVASYEKHKDSEFGKLENFMEFANSYCCFINDMLHSQILLPFDDYKIEVNLINSAIFSTLEEDKGLHYLPPHCIDTLSTPTGADLVIAVMHHSPDWYNDEQKNVIEAVLHEKCSIVFYGHEHHITCKTIENEDSDPILVQAGGMLSNCGDWSQSSFYAGVLDTSTSKYNRVKLNWSITQRQYETKDNRSEVLARKPSHERRLRVLPEVLEQMRLDEKQSIAKSFLDYYVFPRIQYEEAVNGTLKDYTNAQEFIHAVFAKGKAIISGGYNSGKTLLLKYLFLVLSEFHAVVFSGVDNIHGKDFPRMIRSSFCNSYGDNPSDFDRFEQLPKSNKVLIIDDFDQVKQESLGVFLDKASELFGCIILATKQVIDLDLLERMKDILKAADSLSKFTILPFYADKRNELIEKLVAIKVDEKASAEEIASKLIDSISAQRKYLYLDADFTIKYVDYYCRNIGNSSTSDSGVFSRVFEASLANALEKYRTAKLSVDKLFRILAKIAHFIHFNKVYPVSENQVFAIITRFNDEYGDSVQFSEVLRIFLDSRLILADASGCYRFANRNYLAYFVAREVNSQYNLTQDNTDIGNLIRLSCFGINADILLFLSYITDNLRVLNILLQMATTMSDTWPEFVFDKDKLPDFLSIERMHKMLPPSSKEHEQDLEEDVRIERQNQDKLIAYDIYDYVDEDAEEFLNQIIRVTSLLSIISKALPNFEHNMLKEEKDAFVSAIYRLPNKIFGLWAKYADKTVVELIEFFREQSQDYYHRQKSIEDDDILRALQWASMSLLLDLYNISAYNSARENTFDYLSAFPHEERETYSLEHLMMLFRRGSSNAFVALADKLNDEKSASVFKLSLRRVVSKALVYMPGLDYRQQQQLASRFFPDNYPKRLFLQRKASGYAENE